MTILERTRLARRRGGTRFPDRVFRGLSGTLGWLVIALLLALSLLLLVNSTVTWQTFGLGFITGTNWDAVAVVYGALPFIVGTLLSSALALIVAGPVGLLTAIFLAEFADRRLAVPLTFTIELLAAIPSVVIGLWGVFVLSPFLGTTIEAWVPATLGWIPFFGGPTFGVGLFTAGIILAIMILPTIVSISREVIGSVPMSQREAMLALGATRWETAWRAVVPYARSGIIGAIILGLGRALGETMAVTMVIGNRDEVPTGLFDPAQTIASKIATSFAEASAGIQMSSLIALGLVLLVITLGLNVVARLLVRRVGQSGGR